MMACPKSDYLLLFLYFYLKRSSDLGTFFSCKFRPVPTVLHLSWCRLTNENTPRGIKFIEFLWHVLAQSTTNLFLHAKLGKFLLIFEVHSYDSPLSLSYEYDEFCNKLNL